MRRSLSRALIVSGILLMSVWSLARLHAEVGSAAALATFDNDDLKSIDTSLWSPQRIVKFEETLGMHFDPPVAMVRIPRIGLHAPVLRGTNELSLNRGLGWIEGTAAPGSNGNSGIAGHRDGFCRVLKDIVGDEIQLTTADGVKTYVVRDVKIVTPSHVEVLAPTSEPTLTFVTCYPFYFVGSAPERYIVRAVASSTVADGRPP